MELKLEILKNINKQRILIFFFACFLLIIIIYYLNSTYNKEIFEIVQDDIKSNAIEECFDCKERLLDGIIVRNDFNKIPVAVMIDNHYDARPSIGLSKASLVYEAEAEGGITRYLAIFPDIEEVEKIGPIRSARPYFVDWSQEVSALYVHVGGSPEALVNIAKDDIWDMNEFYNGNYFYRDKERIAPHNVVAFGESIAKYILNKKFVLKNKIQPWIFKDGNIIPDSPKNTKIDVNFGPLNFKVEWNYDIINNNYIRSLSESVHKDESGEVITANNIIIQYINSEVIDEKLRLKVNTVGEGRSIICLDGDCQIAKWIKRDKNSRTQYYINDGEVAFNRGVTWVEIIDNNIKINY